MHHFHTKLPYQKPMLRQIKWWLQNGRIKKNGVLPVTTLFFWKFCFSLRTSYKGMICCTNNSNAHICTFRNCWSFIWRSFFPVSIRKTMGRGSHPRCSVIKGVFKNFAKFIGKHLCQSLFFNKVADLLNFAKFLRTPLLPKTCATASVYW